jgi:hypothetical protein
MLPKRGEDGRLKLPDKIVGELRTSAPPRILAGNGAVMAAAERVELLEQLKAGKHVELDIEITASMEPAKPMPLPASQRELANANFSRFHNVGIASFIRSFKDRPFLRDHDQGTILASGGRITSSRSRRDDDGGFVFEQGVRLVEDWAVRGVLNGTIREFSIGWMWRGGTFKDLKQALHCSVCRTSLFGSDCPHWPGDVVERGEGEEPVIAEALWLSRHVYGIETSAVLYPAVEGTGIHEMSALRALKQRGHEQMDKILKQLGLSEDSSREDALAAIQALQAKASDDVDSSALSRLESRAETADKDKGRAETLLAAEREAHDATKGELDKARAELAEQRKAAEDAALAEKQARLDALVERAKDEGRIPVERDEDGEEIAGALERSVRAVAESGGIDVATEYVSRLAKIVPVEGRQSAGVDDKTSTASSGYATDKLTDNQKKVADQLGITHEQFLDQLKKRPHAG